MEAKARGLSRDTVWRAKDELGVKARKQGFTGGWMWHLPKAESCDTGADEEAGDKSKDSFDWEMSLKPSNPSTS